MARSRSIAIALAVALATEATLFAVLLRYTDLTTFGHAQLLAVTAVPVWLVAVWLFTRLNLAPRRAAVLGCLAIGWLLLRRSRPWLAAVWAWCPVVVVEYANNAHIDWLAALLVVLAVSARGIRAAGVLLGAAIAVKVYPALVLPALM